MELKLLLKELSKIKNGTFFYMQWESQLPTKAHCKDVVTKRVVCQVRKGINYSHTLGNIQNQLKRTNPIYKEQPERAYRLAKEIHGTKEFSEVYTSKVEPLPWGKWKYQNLIIEHTNKQGIYKTYLRLYSVPHKKEAINSTKVRYYLNGKEIDKFSLQQRGIVRNSYWKSNETNSFTLCTDNIIAIGKER